MKGTDSIITFEQFQAIIKQMLEISYPDKDVKITKVTKASSKGYVGLTILDKKEKKQEGEPIKPDDFSIAPTHNLDRYFEVYKTDRTVTFKDIAEDIVAEQKRNEPVNYDDELEFHKKMIDIEFFKKHVIFDFINEEKFKELEEDVPNRKLGSTDIKIIYKVLIPDDVMKLINKNASPNVGIATSLVTSKVVDKIKEINKVSISEVDLFNWAMKNTPELLRLQFRATDTGILNLIVERLGDEDKLDELMDRYNSFIKVLDDDNWFKEAMNKVGKCATDSFIAVLSSDMLKYMDSKSDTITFQCNYKVRMELVKLINESMNILTNEKVVHGAVVLLYENNLIPRLLCKLFDKDKVYFVPSSVHEIILTDSILNSDRDLNFLCDTIEEVNMTLSNQKEVLSNKVLAYNAKTNTYESIGRSCDKSVDDDFLKFKYILENGL